jgi:drug/metabolite transporter (DMT)-like permease
VSATATLAAVWALLFSASLWGLTWWPLKHFAAYGLSGPTLAMWAYGLAGLAGLPWLLKERQQWREQTGLLVLIALVGGWANTAFVSALVLGDVVRVMLLFYLAPAWSVLGGWLLLGERVSARRGLAVALCLSGAFLVVGGMSAFASPLSTADLLAITAGLCFSGNNILARKAQLVPTASKTVGVLLGCGAIAVLMMLLVAWGQGTAVAWVDVRRFDLDVILLFTAFSLLWMGLVTFTWQWSVTRLEAGRAGVIAIAELVVAVLSATLSGVETMTLMECLGAALIASAAVLEATDNPSTASDSLSSTSLAKEPT